MNNSNQKIRSVAVRGSPEGKARYQMYKSAYLRINDASDKGFHLEAISIIESMIADRLESRLSYIIKRDFSFQNLGSLITKARQVETDSTLLSLVIQDLDKWRIDRNKALHEMAKIAVGDKSTWQDRVDTLVPIARKGLALLRAIDKQIKQLRED